MARKTIRVEHVMKMAWISRHEELYYEGKINELLESGVYERTEIDRHCYTSLRNHDHVQCRAYISMLIYLVDFDYATLEDVIDKLMSALSCDNMNDAVREAMEIYNRYW